ncbi:MAG TPA: hypothetical protein VGG39_23455 [Polyangiaceae bacterium]|jgi:hypothetical protein
MRPWEETWTAHADLADGGHGVVQFVLAIDAEGDPRRFASYRESDAQLAAAAPDLYRALEAAKQWIPDSELQGAWSLNVRRQIDAALRKARGET